MDGARILVVDDEISVCQAYADALMAGGYVVEKAVSATEGLAKAANGAFDIVLLDKRLPDGDGLDVLRRLRELTPAPEVIMITAYASVKEGVAAIKTGAFDYLIKPVDVTELAHKVTLVLERQQLRRRVDALEEELSGAQRQYGMVGVSAAIRQVVSRIEKIGATDCHVLICGETGTGKELVARALHTVGDPAGRRPFLALNCAALPESVVERELFGHEAGAYTGASRAKPGFFEAADGGSLFLDEVTELSLPIQAKLLRVVDRGEFFRLGSSELTHVQVRLISATNRDPRACVTAGRFREDLFYRLSVVTIEVPPLRERREDIPLLVEHFIHTYARKYGRQMAGCEPEVMPLLQSYDWPGNVRELQHAIEHATALCSGSVIALKCLPPHLSGTPPVPEMRPVPAGDRSLSFNEAKRRAVAAFTREIVCGHLDATGGNITEAAERLGLQRTALQRLMRRYGIDR
ncbi:MAG: Transcriptional regulatory protein ZraR [Lentisphaerae bacterium ADurb.BinA184]|nr:MAG: Transcriptional regulatory protein ZraR [Lentisphaerae bacterium ADurb.BinA184]